MGRTLNGNHFRFFARTVLVHEGKVEIAFNALDRILRNEKIAETARRNMYYEKPYLYRRRLSYEKCQRIYNSDMERKIEFLSRKNRTEPWLR